MMTRSSSYLLAAIAALGIACAVPVSLSAQGAIVALQSQTAQGTISANGGSVTLTNGQVRGFGAVKVQTLDSYSGTWQVQCSTAGANFDATAVLKLTSAQSSSTVTSVTDTVGIWDVQNAGGCVAIRVIATAGFASTDTVVVISATQAGGGTSGGGGGGGGGVVTIEAGGVASGAYLSGSIADGAIVTMGAKADAKSTATDTTPITQMQVLKQISASVQVPPSQAVTNAGTFAVQVTSAPSTAVTNAGTFATQLSQYTPSSGRLPVLADINNGSATATVGGTSNVALVSFVNADPCQSQVKITDPFSLTARGVIIAATSAKKNYICAILVVAATAEIFNIYEGTGTTCQTGTAAILGSTTAANGASFAANGGGMIGTGAAAIINGKTANVDTCIVPSSTNRLSGFVTYVQQ